MARADPQINHFILTAMFPAGKCRHYTPRVPKKVHKKKPARGRARMRKAYNKQFLAADADESDAVGPNSRPIPIVAKLFPFDPMTLNDLKTGDTAGRAPVQNRAEKWIRSNWKIVEWHSGTGGWTGPDPRGSRNRRKATKKRLADDCIEVA
jgi:ribosomal protein S30